MKGRAALKPVAVHQHQLAHPLGVIQGELQRRAAPQGNAHQARVFNPQRVQKVQQKGGVALQRQVIGTHLALAVAGPIRRGHGKMGTEERQGVAPREQGLIHAPAVQQHHRLVALPAGVIVNTRRPQVQFLRTNVFHAHASPTICV